MVRALCLLLLFALVFVIIAVSSKKAGKIPILKSITPQIGVPGDVMVLEGSDFGSSKDTSYVEIGGTAITLSSYLSWTETQIKILLPSDVKDGLVYVVTKNGQSQPLIFANKESIPVAVLQEKYTALPMIFSLSPQKMSIGQVLTITGDNFGAVRNDSSVFFTPQWMEGKAISHDYDAPEQSFVAAFDNDYDYEYWSNTEIRVRIPDGVISGYVFVKTDKGESNRQRISVSNSVGTKQFSGKRTYLVQLTADVSDVQADSDSLITLRVPRPQTSSSQPYVQMTDCEPLPVFEDYTKTVIHHVQVQPSDKDETKEKSVFVQNFVIPVYSVSTDVTVEKVKKLSEKNRLLYTVYTSSDQCVPSDNQEIKNLCKQIIGNQTNPYLQARLIYNFLLDNYKLIQVPVSDQEDPLALISSGIGDSYDFAIIFTALCRSAGIPAVPVSGVLVNGIRDSNNHWWSEFYLEEFGWVPVDLGLGAGLLQDLFHEPESRREYYFGNIDSQHIAFSRGWNEIKPAIINNKTVYRPKTFALQSIWEESTTGTTSYSSFWSEPIVLGIY
ncbi:MAG: IPT/TIG domain-containing protein [Spirochaetaceae bacterium]|nr:IPT/TIG domain-containing protein [Spirochaetaceae bacterium]